MVYLGVQGLMPRDLQNVTPLTMKRIRDLGFSGVACRYFDPLGAIEKDVRRLSDIMATAGINPCQAVAQHHDLIATDTPKRLLGIKAMQHMCLVTRWLGAGNLYLRPGSVNPNGSWYPHPDNFNTETFDVLIESVRQVCMAAEQEGIMLAVEGHCLSILNTPERIRDLIQGVGSKSLKFNADPVNFVGSLGDAYDTTSMINKLFDVLGEYTICGHAKDFVIEERLVLHIEETVIGQGLLDQSTFLKRFEEHCPDGYIQIEHLPDDKIPQAREAFYQDGLKAGIVWKG